MRRSGRRRWQRKESADRMERASSTSLSSFGLRSAERRCIVCTCTRVGGARELQRQRDSPSLTHSYTSPFSVALPDQSLLYPLQGNADTWTRSTSRLHLCLCVCFFSFLFFLLLHFGLYSCIPREYRVCSLVECRCSFAGICFSSLSFSLSLSLGLTDSLAHLVTCPVLTGFPSLACMRQRARERV